MTKINIELGDRVKDPITGIIGIAIARTEWLHGCARITVQPEGATKDKTPFEPYTIDEPQLKLVKKKMVNRGSKDVGGPIPSPIGKMNVAIR